MTFCPELEGWTEPPPVSPTEPEGAVPGPSALDTSPPLLRAEGLSVFFTGPSGEIQALENVSLTVTSGEFLCIVGPSGCGKSTLLRLLAGLLRPTHGSVWLNEEPLTRPRRQIGIVFQKANLMPWRTVRQNVALPLEIAGLDPEETRRRAEALIALVGLSGFEDAYPAELSGGMAQRVAIARALIHDPELLLLDEPFGSLDALTREQMALELLRIWQAQRKTVVMVTHSIPEAVFLGDRVLVMSARPGQIRAIIPVPLPRPRHGEILASETFGRLTQQVRQAIEPFSREGEPPPFSTAGEGRR
ncbi:MAG: ABC transporter ATP-binding protein [Chloroflexi bacterium]|nr:MAG: ABC transporter ATP-binding protein [Chloroflexota bacterium]